MTQKAIETCSTKTVLIVSLSLLIACGGGGTTSDGGAVGGGASPPAATSYNYNQGTPSSESSADLTIASSAEYSLRYIAPDGTSYNSLADAKTVLNSGGDAVATIDTNARAAWQQGWTGKNVRIGITDSFNSNGVVDSHGDWVAIVQSSVAPETTVAMRDVLSSSTLVGLIGDVNSAYDYFEANGYHIINNSWGIERSVRNSSGAYTGALHSDFDSLVNETVSAFDPNSPSGAQGLYILAGGNAGQYCPTRRIENCNWIAAVTDKLRNSGYAGGTRLIFVGSLEDSSNNLADYSYYAGNLQGDFIVAHDDVFSPGDAAGTSFAAPRVAGVAALVKQKFPNLSSAQIKQVLLQTADDLGATGVDEVFGHGKINIMNSLSPQGRVVPK
jgi:hypothetical protein